MPTPDAQTLFSEQAEQSVLGALMMDGVAAMDHCIRLLPEHFYLSSHQVIFNVCRDLLAKNPVIDTEVFRAALGSDRLQSIGGMAYISLLTRGIFQGFDITQRVELILDLWKRRKGQSLCDQYFGRLGDKAKPSTETLADLQAQVLNVIQESGDIDDPHVSAYSEDAFADLMERSANFETSGLSYGLPALDRWTGKMKPGQVTVVGARSGVGKSSLMKQAALANVRSGVPVTLFSLEMPRQEILEGLWALASGVEFRKVSRPHLLDASQRNRLHAACKEVSEMPLRIYDKADLHLDQIVALARMNVRQFGVQLICVDYAQNVEADGKDERARVMSVSSRLTKMANSEHCHVMMLSQLRKVRMEEYSTPPAAADLRETSQLENDAHVIVLLHRGWDKETCRVPNETSVIVPKCRREQTGAFPALFRPESVSFTDEPNYRYDF